MRHYRSFFRGALVVIPLLHASLSVAAPHEETAPAPAPAKSMSYLALHSDLRSTQFSLIDAEARLKEAETRLAQAKELLAMSRDLYVRHAISLEDMKAAQLRYDLGTSRVTQWSHAITSLKAQIDSDVFLLKTTAGAAVDLEKAYAAYQNGWKAQCEKAKSDVVANEAQVAFDRYEYDTSRRLAESRAGSREELLERQTRLQESITELEAAKRWEAQCTELIPTLDFLKQLDK